MKRWIVLGVFSGTLLLNATPSFAEEEFWYKGAMYSSYLKDSYGRTADIGSSTVVVSAGTVYDGRSVGKERIRAWTRDAIVASYYGAYDVSPTEVIVGFNNNDGAPNFVSQVSPAQHTAYTSVGYASWFLKGGLLDPIYQTAIAIANDLNGGVTHSVDTYYRSASVKFSASKLQDVELPSTVKYNDGDSYYNGVRDTATGYTSKYAESRAVVGYFTFTHLLTPGQTATLIVAASANYDIRVETGGLYPAIFGAKTGEAKFTHTITGR